MEFLLRCLARVLLWLRYRVRVQGLDEVAARGTRGVVFLPNHPALIDPVILLTVLHRRFRPRAIADQDQVDRFFVRRVTTRLRVLPMPSIARYGHDARTAIRKTLADAAEAVRQGDNLVLYPAGHAQHSWLEDLRGNSGAETVLHAAPDARVVLVRTRGLWGSSFSWAGGQPPSVGSAMRRGGLRLLLSALIFAPRRRVTIELVEPQDLPRNAPRDALNDYLERFYNTGAQHNTYVPYTLWERGGTRQRPEPELPHLHGNPQSAPAAVRAAVLQHLATLCGRGDIPPDAHLARDLGLDSLARAELLAWLEAEFGFPQGDADALNTVGDVVLAACGEAATSEVQELRPIPRRWFRGATATGPLTAPGGNTIAETFLCQTRRSPGKAIIADQISGTRSYRDLVASLLVLKPRLGGLEGERLGILLPASVAAAVTYLATVFAGKTPVMLNWTLGARNLLHCLAVADVRRIVTLKALVKRLQAQGNDLSALADRFVFLEEIAARIPLREKAVAFVRSRLGCAGLDACKVSDTAAILFTSGSETMPKAVPLTHANVLQNVRSVLQCVPLSRGDSLLAFLPPFHAFGITVGLLAPLCFGLRAVYHANPTDGASLARLIEAYRATLLIGTPTFLSGILRAATRQRLASLRLAIAGAEKCPDHVYDAFAQLCPGAALIEGYGVTECSPVIAASDPREPRRGAIGRLLPSFERLLTHPETGKPLDAPAQGVLHVRGPCVFGGYLGTDAPSPFVEIAGKTWYRTGDIVREDATGLMTFEGRLKRFVKRGGEMISLPAIEAVVGECFGAATEGAPTIAVEATPTDANPEIVLFTTRGLDRDAVNRRLREAGLSSLHNIRRVMTLDAIPLLGTGKTDYRALKAMLAPEPPPAR